MFQDATMPINIDDCIYLNIEDAKKYSKELSGECCFAEPYPHIVIDNFFPEPLIEKVLSNFPKNKLKNHVMFESGYAGLHKRQVMPADCNGFISEVFGFFNSTSIVQLLESLTTIPFLIPDPHFIGGGFHETSKGES